jgi:hypothetical protein
MILTPTEDKWRMGKGLLGVAEAAFPQLALF